MARILVIDDEPQIRRFLRIGLGSQGFEIIEAENGKQGIEKTALEAPTLIILDLGLPDMDGLDVLKTIREFYSLPVLVLSARSSENEKVRMLDGGANDYVVKPFGIQELLARIRVLLRSVTDQDQQLNRLVDGHLSLDVLQHRVFLDGETIKLTRKEFNLLMLLMENRDRVLTHSRLISHLWGKDHLDDSHYLRILVKRLRQKLNDDPGNPRFIETEPGVGYRFLSMSNRNESTNDKGSLT